MVIYYPQHLYDNAFRWHIFPLLKSLGVANTREMESFSMSDIIEDADIIIIPMSWNYYYQKNQIPEVLDFLKHFGNFDKKIFSFITGDTGSKVPVDFKGVVLRASGNKSKLPLFHQGLPIFVDDPIKKFYNQNNIERRTFNNRPVVGFCGQANSFQYSIIIEYTRVFIKNILAKLGFKNVNPQKLMSTSYFRYNILKKLQQAKTIQTNFIIRDQYRAGVKTNKDAHCTTLEFFDNIKNSDYVVCMRGAGNFSNRFYETLAMGRIPVFVNTDCLLPLEDSIDWKKHVVWVEYIERHKIADKIINFHNHLDDETLNDLFKKNRQLWENKLTLIPYFKTIFDEN